MAQPRCREVAAMHRGRRRAANRQTTLTGVPDGNTDRAWVECLHGLGLIVE
jgi:hypothetical protein